MAKGQRWIKSTIKKTWKVGDGPAPEWVVRKFTQVGGSWLGNHNGKPLRAKSGETIAIRARGHVDILKEAA